MTYCETPGALIDVAYFVVFYYNEEFIFNKLNVQFNETDANSLEYYFQLKHYLDGMTDVLPNQLHPFVYVDDTMASILPEAIYDQPLQKHSLNDLLDYLESDIFKIKVYNHWFGEYCGFVIQSIDDIKNIDVRNILNIMSVTEQIKYKIFLCFDDFDASRQKLISLIKKVYDYVIIIRKNNEKIIKNHQNKCNDVNCLKKILTTYNREVSDYYYTIELINAQHLYIDTTLAFITFGIKSYNNIVNNKEISMKSFALAYNNKTRFRIVNLIAKYQQLSINEIVQLLAIKQPTIYHHINMLWEEGILFITNNENQKTHYSINLQYFDKISKLFNNSFGEFQNKNNKENEV